MGVFQIPELPKRMRRIFLAIIGIASVLIIALLVQSFSSPAKAVSEQVNDVQLVSEFPTVAAIKSTPEKYNGQVRKVAYVTFDDGPSVYQEEILNILAQYEAKATFFMIGANVKPFKQSVERLVKEGHYPGLHSMTHDYKKLYTQGQIVSEMQQTQAIIQEVTGIRASLTRCPYGSMPGLTKELRDQMAAAGLKEWDWTVDSFDWKLANNPDAITQQILSHTGSNKEVILLHEKKQTVQVLPAILEGLHNQGYEFEVYEESSHFPLNFWHDDRL